MMIESKVKTLNPPLFNGGLFGEVHLIIRTPSPCLAISVDLMVVDRNSAVCTCI